MDSIDKEVKKYEMELRNYRIPRYEDLPDIELYMDQVLALINKHLSIITNTDNVITPSMVNNYVKFGLIPAPKGKRYTRKHLCYMIALCFLKQVLSMNEIKVLVTEFLKYTNELDAYNLFCNELEIAFKNCGDSCCTLLPNTTSINHCLVFCAKAIAYKLDAQKYINIMNSCSTTAVKADKKNVDNKKKNEKNTKQDKNIKNEKDEIQKNKKTNNI